METSRRSNRLSSLRLHGERVPQGSLLLEKGNRNRNLFGSRGSSVVDSEVSTSVLIIINGRVSWRRTPKSTPSKTDIHHQPMQTLEVITSESYHSKYELCRKVNERLSSTSEVVNNSLSPLTIYSSPFLVLDKQTRHWNLFSDLEQYPERKE